jgi:hypothetical protein
MNRLLSSRTFPASGGPQTLRPPEIGPAGGGRDGAAWLRRRPADERQETVTVPFMLGWILQW